MTIEITRPEVEALINQRLESGTFRDAEDVIYQALCSVSSAPQAVEAARAEAIDRLLTFGQTHRLSLGGMTIRELRHEARP